MHNFEVRLLNSDTTTVDLASNIVVLRASGSA